MKINNVEISDMAGDNLVITQHRLVRGASAIAGATTSDAIVKKYNGGRFGEKDFSIEIMIKPKTGIDITTTEARDLMIEKFRTVKLNIGGSVKIEPDQIDGNSRDFKKYVKNGRSTSPENVLLKENDNIAVYLNYKGVENVNKITVGGHTIPTSISSLSATIGDGYDTHEDGKDYYDTVKPKTRIYGTVKNIAITEAVKGCLFKMTITLTGFEVRQLPAELLIKTKSISSQISKGRIRIDMSDMLKPFTLYPVRIISYNKLSSQDSNQKLVPLKLNFKITNDDGNGSDIEMLFNGLVTITGKTEVGRCIDISYITSFVRVSETLYSRSEWGMDMVSSGPDNVSYNSRYANYDNLPYLYITGDGVVEFEYSLCVDESASEHELDDISHVFDDTVNIDVVIYEPVI